MMILIVIQFFLRRVIIKMSKKVTIIGAGNVGSTIAYTMAICGTASDIVMIDINEKKALGETMDIRQGTPFCFPVSVYAGTYQDAANSDIVIITSGMPRKPGQTRLDLTQNNVDIIKSITPEIVKYAPDAIYIIVSNPVDILTYVFTKISGIPENRIIGSGTILDTARLRSRISEYYDVNQKNVHAYVLGEHGDTAFIPWSLATIASIPLSDYCNNFNNVIVKRPELDYDDVENYMRTSGAKVIERKGSTFYAVAVSVCHICKCIFNNNNFILSISSMMHGEYGIDDVCLSNLAIVDINGISGKVNSPLLDEEIALLRKSADSLKKVISSLNI